MKDLYKKIAIIVVSMLLIFYSPAIFSLPPDEQAALDAAGADDMLDTLPPDAQSLLDETGIHSLDYKELLKLSPGEFFCALWDMVIERVSVPMKVFGSLLGTVLLCAMLESMRTVLSENSLAAVFAAVATVCVAAVLTAPILDCINSTVRAVQDCSNFIMAFIPVFSSILTVGGQAVTATAYTMLLFVSCQVVSQIVAGTLVPLMGIYLALCIAGSVAPDIQIGAIAKMLKSTVTWAMGLLLTIFVAILSMQTLVASGSDAALSKATKFLIGSFIPVVGSALGDAFVATQGYMKLLKTTVGAFGVLVAMMTFLPILLQTAIWYFTVNITASISEMLNVKQVAQILKSAGATLGILIAVICCFALLIIVSTSIVLIVTTGG